MNQRRRLFVLEYLKDLNGTQAAIRAGYSAAGAEVTASKLLRNPKVKQAVDSAIARRAARVEVKVDDIVRELYRLATVDISQAFDSKGALLPFHKMGEDVRRAISGVETDELYGAEGVSLGVTRKVKFWPKTAALELLGKHLRMFIDAKLGDPAVQTSADSLDPKTALKILKLAKYGPSAEKEPTKH